MWGLIITAFAILVLARVISRSCRFDAEYMRLDTELVNREHYANKKTRQF